MDLPFYREYDASWDRHPADFIVSGPIYPARGPGRTFFRADHALRWATEKYGEGNVRLLPESRKENTARWAILVKGKRQGIK